MISCVLNCEKKIMQLRIGYVWEINYSIIEGGYKKGRKQRTFGRGNGDTGQRLEGNGAVNLTTT